MQLFLSWMPFNEPFLSISYPLLLQPSPSTNPSGKNESGEDLLPVSLLCGFLGAGKTTLLKHVLETKHSEDGFKCAVIVNDMATLNIDKSLIDQSALVQTDEVNLHHSQQQCTILRRDAERPKLFSKVPSMSSFCHKIRPYLVK